MAVTKGQGNPKWTRDETALALELYLQRDQKMPSSTDREVIALSTYIRSMEIHKDAHKNVSFRNPDGVAFKIANLSAVATGKGLKNTSQMDQQVWEEFGFNCSALKEYCDLIRSGVHTLKSAQYAEPVEDDYEFSEGRVLTRLHKIRERNRGLRNKLIEKLKNTNKCHCEICKTEPKEALGAQAMSMFECHHIIPVSEVYTTKTKLSDLSLLCANCHRLIHALISKEKRWLKISEASALLDYSI
jgi:5-methylcytosine-specific restriction protein A